MNFTINDPQLQCLPRDTHTDYICLRVIDTLLRENVGSCISDGEIITSAALPKHIAIQYDDGKHWLKVKSVGLGNLYIPVASHHFMQAWRLRCLPLIWADATDSQTLYAISEILNYFAEGVAQAHSHRFDVLAQECQTALLHRRACEEEKQRWFQAWQQNNTKEKTGIDHATWHQRLGHYDRLAAFYDHPFYPTARAKLGFAVDDLRHYGPEFQATFALRWLAIPHHLYCQQGSELPPTWPSFAQVGLDSALANSHALVPIHPFIWGTQLDQLLLDHDLNHQVVRAPKSFLNVTPTLSVRTLSLDNCPAWHIKLPLTIRTLGAKNIRTIKPSTIADGRSIQNLLAKTIAAEPCLAERVLLTTEDTGAHVDHKNFLGFIVRQYPEEALHQATLIPIAALLAQTPSTKTVIEEVTEQFFASDLDLFLDHYLQLTLQLHLRLWIRYGIALESNQQNSVLVLNKSKTPLSLLLKDNDSSRIDYAYLARRWPALASHISHLQDQRIKVDGPLPLAQMFTTITLQLNIAALIETIALMWRRDVTSLYAIVRKHIDAVLVQLQQEGEETFFARRILLEDDTLYIKYLLVAATLIDKQTSGSLDVNKHYGRSAPNFLLEARCTSSL
ncbi:MAG: siderophore biosynthesis protein [Ottowia sp.]|nr:siderophore biosynthesis protein [Ottowia sp.]